MNNFFPIITGFITEELNPALRDIDDIEIRNALFALKENYNPFVLMHHYSEINIEVEFNQNLLNFFEDFVRVYELFIKKYPINLRLNVEVEIEASNRNEEHTRSD